MSNFTTIDKCCDILDSKRIPITADKREVGIYPYYGANGIQGYIADYIFDDELILLAEDGGHFGSKEKPIAYRVSGKCWVNNHAHVLKAKLGYDPDYICYSIMFYDINSFINGTTRKKLNQAAMRQMIIPDLPYPKQLYIVKKLNLLTRLIENRKRQLLKFDELIKSQFIEMFGDPVSNPMGWEMQCIENTVAEGKNALKAGPFGSSLKKEFYVGSGYKIYGQEQVIRGDAYYGDYYIDEDKYRSLESCAVKANDVLISLVGTYGKLLIIPNDFEQGIINPRLMKISFDRKKIHTTYFRYFFGADSLLQSLSDNTHGGTMDILNLGIVKKIRLSLPPISLQTQFADFVQQTEKTKTKIQASLTQLETLYNALMQRYFG